MKLFTSKQHKSEDDVASRVVATIAFALKAALIGATFYAVIAGKWGIALSAIGTLGLISLPVTVLERYKIHLPIEFEFSIVAFLYAAIFLGEAANYYEKIWWWDFMLHGFSSIALSFIGFLILYVLYRREQIQGSALTIAFFAVCFGLAMGAVWEIFEFTMDQIFGLKMQKSGLPDTMGDLIISLFGALITGVAAFLYIKGNSPDLFGRLVKRFMRRNPRLARKSK